MTSILEPFKSKKEPNETGTSSIYASPNNSSSRLLITTSEKIEEVTVALEDLTKQVQTNTTKTNTNDTDIKKNTTNISNLTTRVTNNENNIKTLQTKQISIYTAQLQSLTNLVLPGSGATARAIFPPITSNNLTQADSYIYQVGATKFLHISGKIAGYTNSGSSGTSSTFAIIPYVNLNYLEARVENTGQLIGNATKLTPYYFSLPTEALSGSFSITIALPALGKLTTLNDIALSYSSNQITVDSISNLAIGIVAWRSFVTGTGSGQYVTGNTTEFNIVYS